MTEYRTARTEDEGDLLDFINYVFSNAHQPHDFKTLIPKVYAHQGFGPIHQIAVADGRIRGNVALLPETLHVNQKYQLNIGYVGSVSTHPYDRGAGYMKELMARTLESAKAQNMDLLALGGQRQRYGYWGFERCAAVVTFGINASNVRHAFRDIPGDIVLREIKDDSDPAMMIVRELAEKQDFVCTRSPERLYEILTTWYAKLYAAEKDGKAIGYAVINGNNVSEIVLTDEKLYPNTVSAVMRLCYSADIREPLYAEERISFLMSVSESWHISDSEMIKVLNWKKVIGTLLQYKAEKTALPEGRRVIEITDNGRYEISLQNGIVRVNETQDTADVMLKSRQAIQYFFSALPDLYNRDAIVRAWMPLPLRILSADQF